MHSSHDNHHAMYEANLDKGATKIVVLPEGVIMGKAPIAPDEINNQTLDMDFTAEMKREISTRFVPSTGFKYCAKLNIFHLTIPF